MPVKHAKTLAGASNGNANQVQPGDWNGDHALSGLIALIDALTGTANMILTFDGSGNPQLLPKSSILTAVSPNLTGVPTAPTASQATNSDQIATTAFVKAGIAALVTGSPALLDTLDELAQALGDDPNFATTMTNALALKAPLASPAFTGNPTAPTPATSDSDTSVATTAMVQAAIDADVAAAVALIVAGTTAVPGAVIGSSLTLNAVNSALATAVPSDDTVPTITEGDQIFSVAYTPKTATNKLRITFRCAVSAASALNVTAALFQGSTILGAEIVTVAGAAYKVPIVIQREYTPGTTAAQTISVRVGGDTGSVAINGTTGGRLLGGASSATLLIEEIKG